MKRIQLKQIIREVIKEETSKKRLNEAKLPPATDEIVKQATESYFTNGTYVINKDGSVDFNGDVGISLVWLDYSHIPFVINSCNNLYLDGVSDFTGLEKCNIKGSLHIERCRHVTSFKGLPSKVNGGITIASDCGFTSLKGMPTAGNFITIAGGKNLKNLEGLQSNVNGKLRILGNGDLKITSLKGISKNVSDDLVIEYNKELKQFDFLPEKVGGNIYVDSNGIKVSKYELIDVSPNLKDNNFTTDLKNRKAVKRPPKVKENTENLPEMMLVLDFFTDDQPNDDAATMKVLKVLPNFSKIKKEMKFMLSIDFEEDDYDWDDLATEYADLICDGFEQLFSKMGVEGEAEMTGDEVIEVNVHNPTNAKNVKFFKSLGFEE